MNTKTIEQQMEGDGPSGIDLSPCSVMELVRELKARSPGIVLGMIIEDEDGDERVVTMWQGGRVQAIGMVHEMQHDFTASVKSFREDGQ